MENNPYQSPTNNWLKPRSRTVRWALRGTQVLGGLILAWELYQVVFRSVFSPRLMIVGFILLVGEYAWEALPGLFMGRIGSVPDERTLRRQVMREMNERYGTGDSEPEAPVDLRAVETDARNQPMSAPAKQSEQFLRDLDVQSPSEFLKELGDDQKK